jgi:hypothetical protein
MNRTNIAAAAHIAGIVILVCGAAAASLVALAPAVGSVRSAHAATAITAPDANHQVGIYGDPAAAAPFWRLQHSGDCGEMAVADVVGQLTGTEPTEQQVQHMAENTPSGTDHPGPIWQPGGGTYKEDIAVLLGRFGIHSVAGPGNMAALEQALATGHKVIPSINGETIWNEPGNRTHDDHFVVVTGIDTQAGVVHLNDSGTPGGRDEQVSIATFEQAWATSKNFVTVTTK